MATKQQKLKAWHIVEAALKSGGLKMPGVCDSCGKPPGGKGGANLQAHHDDYGKPLDVKFLCKGCHMEHHHGAKKDVKKDNTTLLHKISLRKNLLKMINDPVVMETHGGAGAIFDRCYSHIERGVVFEKKPEKTAILAKQRPTWFVYEADCVGGIMAGCGKYLPINFLDVDPYGEPWPIISAFFKSGFYLPEKLGIAVNDGLRQKLKMNGGWAVNSMREKVQEYGNNALYKNYLQICQEMIKEISGQHGYELTGWAGYYCGAAKHMTHYAALLVR